MLRKSRNTAGWQDGVVSAASGASEELAHGFVPESASRHVIRKFLSLVMIEHSVFALPFAYIAALTAM